MCAPGEHEKDVLLLDPPYHEQIQENRGSSASEERVNSSRLSLGGQIIQEGGCSVNTAGSFAYVEMLMMIVCEGASNPYASAIIRLQEPITGC